MSQDTRMSIRTSEGEELFEGTVGEFQEKSGKAIDHMKSTAQGRKPMMKADPDFDNAQSNTYRAAAGEIRAFIERFERLEAEKKDIADQQKEVMAEAKGRGYDTKALRKLVALRKKDPAVVSEEQAVLDLYCEALGM